MLNHSVPEDFVTVLHVFKITVLCMVMYSLDSWGHHAVNEAWFLLQILWQLRCMLLLLATVISLKCLILHIFLFCWYTKFENYPTLVCWYKLNKLFCWFSQKVWCQGSYGSSVPLFQQKDAILFSKTFDGLSLQYSTVQYFHSVQSTLGPVSHAILLQHHHVWICSQTVLTFVSLTFYVAGFLELRFIICMNHQCCHHL